MRDHTETCDWILLDEPCSCGYSDSPPDPPPDPFERIDAPLVPHPLDEWARAHGVGGTG